MLDQAQPPGLLDLVERNYPSPARPPHIDFDSEERVFGPALGAASDVWPLEGFGQGPEVRQVRVGGRTALILWGGRTGTAAA